MNLRTRIISAGRIGGREIREDDEVAAAMRLVREKRVEVARGNDRWVEIPEVRLVRRGPRGMLVDAEPDVVFRVVAGDVFARKSASVAFIDEKQPMTFYVSRGGDVVFLEQAGRRTWSELCERRARAEARARR